MVIGEFQTSSVSGRPDLSCRGATGCYCINEFRNGSALWSSVVYVNGTSAMMFEDSFLGGLRSQSSPAVINHNSNDVTSRWDFVRSEFYVSKVHRSPTQYKCRYGQNYFFEDTLWSCGDNDLEVGATNVNMNIYVRGSGLRFAPYAGRTYTVIRKIRGGGGIVMDGPGTLRFGRSQYLNVEQADPVDINPDPCIDLGNDTGTEKYHPCTVCYSGATEVNGGTIDFGGFSLTNMTLSGAGGVVSNAHFVNTTLANTNLTFTSGIEFSGKTHVDFSDADVSDGDVVVIGRYTGAAPDVAAWRGRNFAKRGLKALFSAEGGEITASVQQTGVLVIVK